VSTTPISLLPAGPAAGFDAPFEMLAACHERVERMLRLLERLEVHLADHGADDRAASAARDVMRYFDVAGPAHHEDEERHVLPALAAAGRDALAQQLHAEHLRMSLDWQALRADLAEIAAGRWSAGVAELRFARWQAFARLYREHILLEEAQAYPEVAGAADAASLAAMGEEMAARRGLR
jgi:hemerythrin-like domain-containing protein